MHHATAGLQGCGGRGRGGLLAPLMRIDKEMKGIFCGWAGDCLKFVMPGLVPGIHALPLPFNRRGWAGTSPAMTAVLTAFSRPYSA